MHISSAAFSSQGGLLACAFCLVLLLTASTAVAAVAVRGDLGLGYREDHLDWSIAGELAGKNPNILSELEWDVESVELTGDFWMLLPRDGASTPFARIWGGYGFIGSGQARDSDYLYDNRTGEYARIECVADDGHLYDIAGALGWEVARPISAGQTVAVAPFAGFAYSSQELTMTDGRQVVSSGYSPPLGPLPGLDSRYTTSWQGPLAGVRLRYARDQGLSWWLEGSYHRVDYEGAAKWNLRPDFAQHPSFRQTADGNGWSVIGGGTYVIGTHQALAVALAYRHWIADSDGVDTLYLANGTTLKTHFNEAEWEAWSVSLRYEFKFNP